MDFLFLIGGVLAILVGIVFFVLSYPAWRWLHWLAAISVLLAAATFLPLAVGVYGVRTFWVSRVETLTEQLAAKQDQILLLRDGRQAGGGSVSPVQDSLAALRAKIERINFGRGRIWRNLTPTNIAATVQLGREAPAADPAAPAAPAAAGAPAELVAPGMIVYAFRQDAGTAPGGRTFTVPRYFLGEFKVDAADATSVTLSPTLPLAGWQQQMMRQPNDSAGQPARWTLMEAAPIDDPESLVLGTDPKAELEALIPTVPELQALLPKPAIAPTLTDADYGVRLQRIRDRIAIDLLFNNQPLESIRAAYPWFDPQYEDLADSKAEPVWHYVVLKQPWKVKLDNAPTDRDPTRPIYYNDAGEAVNGLLLKAAVPVKGDGTLDYAALSQPDFAASIHEYAAGQRLKLPASEATKLVEQGVANPPQTQADIVYVRPLRDYPYLYHALSSRITQLVNSSATMDGQIRSLQQALADVEGGAGGTGKTGQIVLRQQERDKLTTDLANTRQEAEKLTAVRQTLETTVKDRLARIEALRQQNLAIVRDYTRQQLEKAEENEQRLRSAAVTP